MSEIIKEFNSTGPCLVDIDALEIAWDHRFMLSQWKDEYRLIQYLRKGSEATKLKCTISTEQAQEIIQRLELARTQSLFASGGSWRKADWTIMDMTPQVNNKKNKPLI